jgi:hypothetical protein
MKYAIPLIIYSILFLGSGYLILKFFSVLTNIDMFGALKWGFNSKKFEIVLPLILLYLIAFVMFFAVILSSIDLLTAKITQKGGLLGYQEDDYLYKYYDPLGGEYLQIKHYNPPPVSSRFDEVFSVVSFYKSPFSDHYQNVTDLSLAVSIIKIIIFLIGAIPFYLVLVLLAKEFGKNSNPAQIISHKLISDSFKEITKLDFFTVICAVIIIIAVITVIGVVISRDIISEHEKIYSAHSDEYKSKIMRVVSPGKKITGKVIRREEISIKHYDTENRYDDTEVLNKTSVNYTSAKVYTVEFLNILHIPVYLSLQFTDDESSKKFISKLDGLFIGDKSSATLDKNDVEFIVNKDYSISLPE